jgi:DnaD/phage-associated family protein
MSILLQTASPLEATLISNQFIDQYMPRANGEFVKVYLYLVRILSGTEVSFSLEETADRLLCTEKDILRALKYWEKEKLVSLRFTSDKKLNGILLLSPEPTQEAAPVTETPHDAEKPAARLKRLTPDRVKELKQNEAIVQLLYIAEQYLSKTLTPSEIQRILYFYDELKMSPDLIEYLIEYCVSRNHKSIRYIETVALAWAQEGITTVKMAKESTSRYSRDYYTILKAMGISNRNPIEDEIAYMDTWMKEYGFDMAIIQEACSRTVLQTGQPSFQYAEKILAGWKSKGVQHLADIYGLDAEHQKRRLEKKAQQTAKPAQPANRFNNFHQREYDFDEYEKRLLNQ